MCAMANRASLGVWVKGFSEESMLKQFGKFLETVPFSAERPGFAEMVIHAVDPGETPLIERDLRAQVITAEQLVELTAEYRHADCAYEVLAHWDLWLHNAESGRWQQRAQRLEILCHGEEYDDGVFTELGHFHADIGFEHLFTGHAGLLGAHNGASASSAPPQHPTEADFLARMAQPENLREYHQRTRENIEKLMNWTQAIERALPVETDRMWKERRILKLGWMKFWLYASALAACITYAHPQQRPASAQETERRVNELALAGLRPGKDTLAIAERRYKPKYRETKPGRDGGNLAEWWDRCNGKSLRLELNDKGIIQSVTISALAPRQDCMGRPGDFLNQKFWTTGRGLKLRDPRDLVVDLYGEPNSSGPSVKGNQELELLFYLFDWAGSDVPQVMEVSCERATGRVVEITLALPSL